MSATFQSQRTNQVILLLARLDFTLVSAIKILKFVENWKFDGDYIEIAEISMLWNRYSDRYKIDKAINGTDHDHLNPDSTNDSLQLQLKLYSYRIMFSTAKKQFTSIDKTLLRTVKLLISNHNLWFISRFYDIKITASDFRSLKFVLCVWKT